MKTDINKLHKVIDSNFNTPREAGKLYAKCHIIAGHVELDKTNIFILISNWGHLSYTTRMLKDVFREHKLEFRPQAIRSIIKSGDSTLRFILNDSNVEDSMRGREGLIVSAERQN